MYYRGGHIVPRRERVRRSSASMRLDPFTLVIAQDSQGHAQGSLYMDDEETYSYQKGIYTYTTFNYAQQELTCQSEGDSSFMTSPIRIERVRILGFDKSPQGVKVVQKDGTSQELQFTVDQQVITVKDPKVSIVDCDWRLVIY